MKQLLLSLLALLLCHAAVLADSTQLSNGDFESKRKIADVEKKIFIGQGWKLPADDWLFYDWKPNPSFPGEYQCIQDPALCHGGTGCLYVRGGFISTTPFNTSQKQEQVTVTCWARSREEGPTRDAIVSLYLYTSSYAFLKELTFEDQVGKDWTQITKDYTVPATVETKDGEKPVDLFVVAVGSHSGCLFDDVSAMVKTP